MFDRKLQADVLALQATVKVTKMIGLEFSRYLQSSANNYFGGARSKGFATLRSVSKLQFFDKIGHVKSVGFRFYSAI